MKFSGDTERAQDVLVDVAVRADAAGNRRVALLARLERVWPELASGQMTPDEALELAASAQAVFEAENDEFGLARALHIYHVVNAVYKGRYTALDAVVDRMRGSYERSGSAAATTPLLAVAAHRGPTPVPGGPRPVPVPPRRGPLSRLGQLRPAPPLAALEAMAEHFDDARAHLNEPRLQRREVPAAGSIATNWSAFAAEVELLADNPAGAEEILLEACETLRRAGDPPPARDEHGLPGGGA